MNGGLSAIFSTGIFAAQASRVLKRQQDCKGTKSQFIPERSLVRWLGYIYLSPEYSKPHGRSG